jgi:predicted Zn-dependent peptidase
MGLHTFGRMHRDRFGLVLLHIILGANMSSRLFENLREKKGLAYDIGSEVKRYVDTGAFIVNAGLDHKKAIETVKLIVDELIEIKKNLVGKDELERAKEYFGVQLSLALEDTVDHMLWIGEHVITTDETPNKKAILKKIESVSLRDIQRIARNIFTSSNANAALIGPLRDKEKDQIEKELSRL